MADASTLHRRERHAEHLAGRLAHVWQDVVGNADATALPQQAVLQLRQCELVVVLKGIIVLRLVLDCIIGEVDTPASTQSSAQPKSSCCTSADATSKAAVRTPAVLLLQNSKAGTEGQELIAPVL